MKKYLKYLRSLLAIAVVIALFAALLFTHSQVRSNIGTNENFGLPEILGEDITDLLATEEYPAFKQNGLTMYVSFGGAIRVVNDTTNEEIWRNTAKDNDEQLLGSSDAAMSPVMLTYRYDGETDITLYSNIDAVDKEQYSVSYSEDGKRLRVSYLFGEIGQGGILPLGISKECMENEILPALSEDDRDYLLRRYILYTADTAKAIVLEDCPGVKKNDLYYLENCASPAMIRKTTKLLAEAGMTQKLYDRERKITGEAEVSYNESYGVTVEYWLDGGDVMVNVPCDEIKFHPENPLTKITLNGGATYTSQAEEGQYFLPAGSGALQDFYSAVERNNSYKFYGTNDLDKNALEIESEFPFPIFAVMRKNTSGLMGIIESGAELATLNERFSYGAAQLMLDISVLEYGDSSVTVQQTSTVFNSSVYDSDFTVRYRSLKSGITPSELAVEYRELLKSQNKLPEKQQNTDSVLLEMVGNVSYSYQLAGLLPVNKTIVLTDWQQSREIYSTFLENGISPAVKLSGYNKNGLYCQAPGKYSFSGKLGSKNDREEFLSLLDKNKTDTFLDVNLAYSYVGKHQGISGYSAQSNNARKPNNKIATYIIKSPSTGDALSKVGTLNVVSPANYFSYAKAYENRLDKRLDISLGDSLLSLNIDYSEKTPFNRMDTMEVLKEAVRLLSENRTVMAKNPVLPLVKNISVAEDLKLLGKNEYSITEYFPFVQMVLHGYVNYTTDALNAKSNYTDELLTAIETGTALKYTVVGKLSNLVAETEYDYLYFTDWEKWKETIIKDSKTVTELYEKIKNAEILSYERFDDVAKTVYSNGVTVYVNHNDSDVTVDGITVAALSWKLA